VPPNQTVIAIGAKKTPDLFSDVVVVDTKPGLEGSRMALTNSTKTCLPSPHCLVLFGGDAINPT